MSVTPTAGDSGYSPPLSITLGLDGRQFNVAELGPDFLRLHGAVAVPPHPGTVRIEIDGRPTVFRIDLFDGVDPQRKRQPFRDRAVLTEPVAQPMVAAS